MSSVRLLSYLPTLSRRRLIAPIPSVVRYSVAPSLMPRQYEEEIVADSEPEREELRRKATSTRPRAKIRQLDVIELTDEENQVSQHLIPRASKLKSRVHEMLLPPTVTHSVSPIRVDEGNTARVDRTKGLASSKAGSSVRVPPAPPAPHGLFDSGFFEDTLNNSDDEGGLDIARFAYTKQSAKAKPNLNARKDMPMESQEIAMQPSAVSDASSSKKKQVRIATRQQAALDFPDTQLTKLLKCVSCDARWTSRKTVPQKVKHILACAKKSGFSDETLSVLIKKELENIASLPKPAAPERSASTSKQTFFEDVVKEAAPKKRARREQLNELRPVGEAHETIRRKAQAILGASTSEGVEEPARTQAIIARPPAPVPQFPPTQGFGKSSLLQTSKKSLFAFSGSQESDPPSDTEEPPMTQPFAPSKLGTMRGNTLPSGSTPPRAPLPHPILEDTPPIPQNINRSLHPFMTPPHFSASGVTLRAKRRPKNDSPSKIRIKSPLQDTNAPVIIVDSDSAESHHGDDGILHFDPNINVGMRLVQSSGSPSSSKGRQTYEEIFVHTSCPLVGKAPAVTASQTTSMLDDSEPDVEAPPIRTSPISEKKARKPRSKNKGEEVEQAYGPEWEEAFRNKIVQDTQLYMRILRYEPIHFDVFLALAGANNSVSPRQLESKLRLALDEMAIILAKPTTSRRR